MGRGRRMTDLAQTLHELTTELIQLRQYQQQTNIMLRELFSKFPEAQAAFQKYAEDLDKKPEMESPKEDK